MTDRILGDSESKAALVARVRRAIKSFKTLTKLEGSVTMETDYNSCTMPFSTLCVRACALVRVCLLRVIRVCHQEFASQQVFVLQLD